jgi:putative radical SAM enzyme (TIGR03279 family)
VKNSPGVEIDNVLEGSIAQSAGLLRGDTILSVNGCRVSDDIDLMFHGNDPELALLVKRKGKSVSVNVNRADSTLSDLGIVTRPFKIKTCRNKCVFCFVAQLPRGLRRTLYVKDEDYRMSFLYGNYITLTNLSDSDKNRIVKQKLSPLYLSVHSTNPAIRSRMLGNPDAADIMKELKYLAGKRIGMHTQIVLCPGYNDGEALVSTLRDLYRFYPHVMSIAVVPVGLTSNRNIPMQPLGRDDAAAALETVHRFQTRFKRKHGEHIVFAADELYIKAGIALPPLEKYDDLPQIENGVGMTSLFSSMAKKISIPPGREGEGKRFLTFTGVSFYPYLSKFAAKIVKAGYNLEAVPVENEFFGKSVTVTGLLTGRDIIRTLSGIVKKGNILLIPDVVMREGDDIFLDDISRQDIEEKLGVKAVVIGADPKGLVEAVTRGIWPPV